MKRSIDEFGNEPKSKSQFKREAQAFDDLGKKLVSLSEKQLEKMQLVEPLKTAVISAQTMQKEAFRRQLQYIGKLLRKADTSLIEDELARIENRSSETNAFFQRLEKYRDRLIANDEALLEELINLYSHIDRQHIRQLIRNAQKELSMEKPQGSAKVLFRYLRKITETDQDDEESL